MCCFVVLFFFLAALCLFARCKAVVYTAVCARIRSFDSFVIFLRQIVVHIIRFSIFFFVWAQHFFYCYFDLAFVVVYRCPSLPSSVESSRVECMHMIILTLCGIPCIEISSYGVVCSFVHFFNINSALIMYFPHQNWTEQSKYREKQKKQQQRQPKTTTTTKTYRIYRNKQIK